MKTTSLLRARLLHSRWLRAHLFIAAFAPLAALPIAAWAGPITTLDADAQAKVLNDEMHVTLSADRDGPNVAQLNEAVLQELNAALTQAKRSSAIKARLAGVYTNPLYTQQGKPNGYKVTGRIELVSTDFVALSNLASDLGQKLQLSGVSFQVTLERRNQEEQKLMSAAANAFRAKAQNAAQAFGFKEYEIKTLTVGTPSPVAMARGQPLAYYKTADRSAAAPLPAEGGESDISVSISGTVEFR